MSAWKTWWDNEGSAMRPSPNEDIEEFARRITQIAWSNGEYVERIACAEAASEKIKHRIKQGFAEHGHAEAVKRAIMKRDS